jgi:beta-galactosidase GanA
VPAELLQAMGTNAPGVVGNWPEVFGTNADEYFQAWSVARFIGQVAAAGKKEYPLPMYVNASLRDPLTPGPASGYESGGATDNVLWIWKIAAPAIDILAPDIYQGDDVKYRKVLELYSGPDKPLFVPETRGTGASARMCFAALGHGTIGWSPFGLDFTKYANGHQTPGAPQLTEASLAPIALNYEILGPIMRAVARLNFEGKLQAVAEEKGQATQTLDFGNWTATVGYGISPFGYGGVAHGNSEPIGRALIAKIGENEFLVAGAFCRVDFKAASGGQRDFLRVEELGPALLSKTSSNSTGDSAGAAGGRLEGLRFLRIWNGDETDWGLDFSSAPEILRVSLGTY